MHPALIKAALEIAGVTQKQIADECKVSPPVVYDVIHGNRRCRRVEIHIAAVTQQLPAALWPKWYGPEAGRRKPMAVAAAFEQLKSLARAS